MTSTGVTALISGGDVIIDITNTGLMIADNNYGLIVVHGGSGNLTFRELETTPGGSQTQATFTNVAAAPKIYMCALYPSISYASAHRVNSVAYMDNTLLTATNFFTNNSYCYSSGFTSTLSGTSLTIASNGQQAGGFFHSGVYKLYYLTAADLGS